jgi:hypothetical protein
MRSEAVIEIEARSLTKDYGEDPLDSGRSRDIFSMVSERLKVA